MALADIIEKITQDGAKKSATIIATAKERAAAIIKRAEADCTGFATEAKEEQERALADNKRRVVAMAEQERKLQREKVKRRLVDEAFRSAEQELINADDATYQKVITALLATVTEKEVIEVRAPAARLKATERALKETGIKVKTVTADDSVLGGLLLVGETFEFDLTISRTLDDLRGVSEIVVAETLLNT